MKIHKNAYYDQFSCVASDCPDSCCQEWSICVDPDSAARYRALPGELGDRLRRVLTEEDGDTVMRIENGRCPMWRDDGLCRIQAQLGHDALCHTCRQFPRLTHDYGDFQEWTLELSCPEAAKYILLCPSQPPLTTCIPGGEAPEYDRADMACLLRTRQELYDLLSDRETPVGELLAQALLFGYHAQSQLDGAPQTPFDREQAAQTARDHAAHGDKRAFLAFFEQLEILTPRWREQLKSPCETSWTRGHIRLFRYFTERYYLQAISDFDLVGRIKLGLISCLAVRLVGGELVHTAQLYSKEIENDPDNVEAILDGAYSAAPFTDDKLLDLLLNT